VELDPALEQDQLRSSSGQIEAYGSGRVTCELLKRMLHRWNEPRSGFSQNNFATVLGLACVGVGFRRAGDAADRATGWIFLPPGFRACANRVRASAAAPRFWWITGDAPGRTPPDGSDSVAEPWPQGRT